MLIPITFPTKLQHQDENLEQTFSLLVWNVHKENQQETFQEELDTILLNHPSDFLLFQEVQHPKSLPFSLQHYSYALSSNIETSKNIFGVVTACKSSFKQIDNLLTTKREMGFATHKSAIITQHHLYNEELLYVVNLHAINFVSVEIFKRELLNIKDKLKDYTGALIIAGDFNSWNNERMQSLIKFQNEFSLKVADVENQSNILHMFSFPIDHIFYRGLELLQAKAIDTKEISDHNPIYARFKV